MRTLEHSYIGGRFVKTLGADTMDIINPSTEAIIGHLRLAGQDDVLAAIEAASKAQRVFSRSSKQERIAMLRRLEEAVREHVPAIREATVDEYGAPPQRAMWASEYAAACFGHAAETLEAYPLTRQMGAASVMMEPVGVSALITPWNSVAGSICSKLAYAIAAGCAVVIKPSELGAIQAQAVAEAVHAADLPPGIVNMVIGRGDPVGATLSTHPDIAKISFTGSTQTGKAIARAAIDSMKRVSLALTGKSPSIILDDADFPHAVPLAIQAGLQNSGQACVAGTRLLVPASRLDEVIALAQQTIAGIKVGDPRDPQTAIGPMISAAQYERVRRYIRIGNEEGAVLIAGGDGRPEGIERGYFVRPTVFAGVSNDMTIAQEEIFGPVLSIITYRDDEEAIAIANDSPYGLQAYVFSTNSERARAVASRLLVGGVKINSLQHEALAPFGGYKASGLGREGGVFGLESFLEAKAIIGDVLASTRPPHPNPYLPRQSQGRGS
jgi:aldehyde dehydrogenase (NAD+)